MSEETARAQFSDVVEFDTPDTLGESTAARFIDDEAGVVFYGFAWVNGFDNAGQMTVTSHPLADTELEQEDEY